MRTIGGTILAAVFIVGAAENCPRLRVAEKLSKAEVGRIIDEAMTRKSPHGVASPNVTYQVNVDRPSGIYRCGETATFTVRLISTNALVAVKNPYARLDNFGAIILTNMPFDVTATSAAFTVSGTLREPGFLRLSLPPTKDGRKDPSVFSVGFEPEKIRKGSPSPVDFDSFWAGARARLASEVPIDAQMDKVPGRCTADFNFYRISFATFGRRVHGYMSIPSDSSKAPFPVDFEVSAAGFGSWTNDMRGDKDSIRVQFSVYPFPPDWKWKEHGLDAEYKAMNIEMKTRYGVSGYASAGIAESREAYFFYPVILGIDRAVDWIAARPDVDRSRFRYRGTSQGGGFGFYLCGVNHAFTRAALYVPALTDTMGYLSGRQSGWPQIVENNSRTSERRAAAEKWAPYFDGANFASRIECPVRIAVGFSDATCPPCAVYAAYNEIPVRDKAIENGIGMTHNCRPQFYKELGEWLQEPMSLEAGFLHPPMSARPQTWWHWMNGNVSKEGITADLEAMRKIGLGGATLFDAGLGVPAGSLKFASPEWFDFVKHAAAEARRLGLEICLPNCSGWSSSGGPWNPVANSMKELVRTEVRFTGPRHVREKLPPLPNAHGFAADIAVLAVPVPPAELATMEKAGGVVTAPSNYVREISFPEPFAADGVFFRLEHDWLWEVAGDVKIEISEDGRNYTELMTADATLAMRAGWDRTERYRPFPREVKARFYRLTFDFRVIGLDLGDHTRLKNTKIASVRIGRAKSLSNLCDKTFAKRMPVVADPDTATGDQVVAKDAVRVLALADDGTLDWDVPTGEWRVIRLGFAANGKKNHPASDCGGGFEVDKLSPAALDYHFEQYAAKLVRHLGPLAGNVSSGLAGILVDSYEIGAQNWTQGFEREFSRRRGYDMTPYLPVLAGVVIGSVDESERFLSDFRRTVADLFAEGYSGALARKCHQYGLKLWLEPYGNCPCDDLEYGDDVDLPMCEFWSRPNCGVRYTETGNARLPGYLAHVWGRRYAGAEAFTAAPPSGGRWTTTPFALKAQGDRAFAKGVNRLIFHRFCHQPFVKPGAFAAPGFTLGVYGIHLDRTQTWWKQGRPYMDYLARCQWMLQEGRNVADVLFWHGEEAPSRGGHVVGYPEDFTDHPVPNGFGKDVCSTKALKALNVADGKVVAPSGARYEMLVLQDVSEMSSATLEAVGRLVESGATVVAPRMPTKVPGLWHYPHGDEEVRSRAAAIWKKGVVTGGATDGIAALGLSPDFVCLSAAEGLTNETAWIHRRYEDGSEAYFVSCPNAQTGDFRCSFRVDGFRPELWDAESGKIGLAPKSWRRIGGRTEVAFTLPPSGSVFVVFRARTEIREGFLRKPQVSAAWREIQTGWRVTFPVGWYEGGTEVKTIQMDSLGDWTSVKDNDIRYFSGTACYETEIPDAALLPALRAKKNGRRVILDLGDVRNFAEVAINGQSYPALWRPPYRVDVTEALVEKRNKLVVRVTNLWPNRMIGDERLCAPDCEWTASGGLKELPAFIREGRSSPTGRKTFATWHHWKKDDKLLPSGLLGPVQLSDIDGGP